MLGLDFEELDRIFAGLAVNTLCLLAHDNWRQQES